MNVINNRLFAITGCGPIGLLAIAVAKQCGAAQVFALEVNEYRRKLAAQMNADLVFDPVRHDTKSMMMDATGGRGVDVLLEMSGHPDAIKLGFSVLRSGRRASLLGIPSKPLQMDLAADVIFKGATLLGINGRRMYETWYQMQALLKAGKLDLQPVITDRIAIKQIVQGMERLNAGAASKILLYPNGVV